jgi:N-acyl-D-amino-acid deacylase
MIILRNATVYDGTGKPGVASDVLIDGGRIRELAVGLEAPAARVIDCSGMSVSPGFIDIHSHSDVMVMENDRAKTDQGVTSEVVGNCGFSPYPAGKTAGAVSEYGRGILAGPERWGWKSAKEYLSDVRAKAQLSSVWSLVGHGSLRTAHAGAKQGKLEAKELDAMQSDLTESLQAGASGFSTGFMYAPGSSAPRDEVIRLLRVVAKLGKVYATHMRSYSFQLLEAIEEQLDLAREAGCKLQISHLQTVGRANWDKQDRALARLEQAREQGIDVEFDSYPYLAGSTVLTQLLPQSTLDGGIPAMLGRLKDPASRKQIAKDTVDHMAQQWSDIFISSVGSADGQRFVGKHFDAIAEMLGVEPIEAVFRLLEAEQGNVNMLSFNQSDANLQKLLSHPLCTVITDGFYVKGRPHPRLYGTFPCLLGEMVRERKWLGLAEAIHKITGKPAARYDMTDRGTLRAGAYADIVVFYPSTIQARATYEDPQQSPVGVKYVFREGKEILGTA